MKTLKGPIFFSFLTVFALSFAQADQSPKRIVTLIPSLGEMVAELLGDTARIVGVSEYTDYPNSLKAKPSVGPYDKVSLEKVIVLKPDLVLAAHDGNAKDQVLRLQELKVPTLVLKIDNVAEVGEAIAQVGAAVGRKIEANQLKLQFFKQIQTIRGRNKARAAHPIKVLLQVGDEPLIVAGGSGFLNEAITLVGAENVYSDLKSGYPRVTYEDVVKRNPDMIVVLALHGEQSSFDKMISQWKRFPSMKATKTGQLKILKADELLRPGVRLPVGIEKLESVLPKLAVP